MRLRTPRSLRARWATAAGAAALVAISLTACTNGQTPEPTSASTSASAPSTATTAPVPSFDANGSAGDARAYFDVTMRALLASNKQPDGKTVVDALVKAGFDKKSMEVTPDQTTIGRTVDSIEFSVLWKTTTCIVGQVGASGYSSSQSPVLSTGKCLIGTTRAIDW